MKITVPIMVKEILASCPDARKMFADKCKVNRTPVALSSVELQSAKMATTLLVKAIPLRTVPIMELDVKIQGVHSEVGLYDCGSELVCISKVAVKELGLPFSTDMVLNMCNANGGVRSTYGIVENLQLVIGGISVYVHAWIIQNTLYQLLLG